MIECPTNEDMIAFSKKEFECIDFETISSHVQTCTSCAQELVTVKKHLSLYSNFKLPNFENTEKDWLALKEKLQSESPTPIFKPHLTYWLTFAASIIFLASIIYSWVPTPSKLQLVRGTLYNKNAQIGFTNPFYTYQQNENLYTTNAIAEFKLSDKVVCFLDCKSEISVENTNNIHLKKGNVFFNVTPGTFFRISTKYGNVKVLGTSFLVEDKIDFIQVSVYKGKVQFTTPKNVNYLISRGQALAIDKDVVEEKFLDNSVLPKWLSVPLALDVRCDEKIEVTISNITSADLNLRFFSGSTPHLLFHVQYEEVEFETPVFTNKNIFLKPGENKKFLIDKKDIIQEIGKYKIFLIFQGHVQGKKPWSGIIRSSTITIDNQK